MNNFFSGFFQFGYVTRNLDAACAAFRDKFGQVEFLITDPVGPDGGPAPTKRLALTWIDDVMTEIIEPDFDQKTIYDHAIPAEAGPLCLHHFGYLIDDHEGMLKRLAGMGYALPMHGSLPGFLDFSYADTRADLGVFSEFIRLDKSGKEFFDSAPRIRTR